jgi:hypothetical protein
MGDFATPQALLHRWGELQHDPSLRELPYKIELNAWGKVEMSPASVRHGQLQAALAAEFMRQLGDGVTVTEWPILTDIGIRVLDLAWASAEFICVEVMPARKKSGSPTRTAGSAVSTGWRKADECFSDQRVLARPD